MEHFVTLFDILYLPQGLALYQSMLRYTKNFTLWILCVDDESHQILTTLSLPNIRLLRLSSLETDDLLRIKSSRTKGEYCWTLTPFAPRFVFEADSSVDMVTYVDADIWFLRSPKPILDEFIASKKNVLITEHGYAPEYDQSEKSGRFCVQFLTFKRDGSEEVRSWWEGKCIEWCYAKFENGLFGDQMYLNEWPEIFSKDVHVLNRKEYALAPWNATRFTYSEGIFYHFHGLKFGKKVIYSNGYVLPPVLIENVYAAYLKDLLASRSLILKAGFSPIFQNTDLTIMDYIKGALRGPYKNSWRLNTLRVKNIK